MIEIKTADPAALAAARAATMAYSAALPGWFPTRDAEFLYDWAMEVVQPGGLVVEVGVWQGKSTVVLAAVCAQRRARLIAIDTFAGYPDRQMPVFAQAYAEGPDAFMEHAKEHLASFKGTVLLWRGDSRVLWRGIPKESCDLIFLDGDHDSPGFDADVKHFAPCVRVGGIFAGHDYGHAEFPDVKRVIDERYPDALIQKPCWAVQRRGPAVPMTFGTPVQLGNSAEPGASTQGGAG